MFHQNTLPLTSLAAIPDIFGSSGGRSRTDCEIRVHETRARKAFRRVESATVEHVPTRPVRILEPYRGAESPVLGEACSRRRSRRLVVREGLVQALRRELHAAEDCGEPSVDPIVIGSSSEPYPWVEARLRATRSVLETLCEARGLEIHITTRSPLILRDQDILSQLDLNHAVIVGVSVSALDAGLAAAIEPGAEEPRTRLEVVRQLAADGIATEVVCSPVLPGINSSADELDPLFAAARDAGAMDVIGDPRALRPANRRRLLAAVAREFPERADAVRKALGQRSSDAVLGTLRRLRLAYGFPALKAGRG